MTLLDVVNRRLPAGWRAEQLRAYGIVIECDEGSVTICEQHRNFTMGCSPVRKRGEFTGAKWKERLANAAINALFDHEQYWKNKRAAFSG